jgi:3-oxoacyl-[acyl-carrier protein] reductase
MNRLAGKLALVTGAATGIGAAIARRFREEGADVIINDLRQEAAEEAAKELGATAYAADVADSQAVARMFGQLEHDFGRLDVLVNNAGIGVEGDAELEKRLNAIPVKQTEEFASGEAIRTHWDVTAELSDEKWHRMIGVHLNGTFFCCREALKLMNVQMSGAIINMGSVMGTAGNAGAPHYCAAKGGILGFTRSLPREVASRNIRVNALAPGFIETAMTQPFQASRRLIEAQHAMGRFGEPDDIAWAGVYLASDEARFVTGQVLSPNGGFYMSQ